MKKAKKTPGFKVVRFDSKEEWLVTRLGKVTGSKLKDIGINSKTGEHKIGDYRLVAEGIIGTAALVEDEDMTSVQAMERGTRLEKEAVQRFREETGKRVDDSLLLWVSEEDERMAYSPDGVVSLTEGVECKCLSAARHVEAILTKRIPKEYEPQTIQAFIVNPKLRTLWFVFYDPRFPKGLDYFCLKLERKHRKQEIEKYIALEKETLKWVRAQINTLTMYSPEELQKQVQVQQELMVKSAVKVLAKV